MSDINVQLGDGNFSEGNHLQQFESHIEAAWSHYVALSIRGRVAADAETATAYLFSALMMVFWFFNFPNPNLSLFASVLISPAEAATPDQPGSPQVTIQFAIFGLLFLAFAISLLVSYFSKNKSAVRRAADVSKTLLGFFIGAATHFLGMTG